MIRQALTVSQCSVPGFGDPVPGLEAIKLSAKMEEWNKSDFAGFRRILQKGSDCYPDLAGIQKMAEAHRKGATGKAIRDFVVLGMGGSSLSAEAILRSLRSQHQEPRFHFMDNSDPQWLQWLLNALQPEETLFYVVAKSGGTPETISQFLVVLDWMKKAGDGWKKHFVLCTDPAKGDLRTLASRWKLECLEIPPAVGGRFSVLTSVGLFPAAFAGLPLEDFLQGAESVANWDRKNWSENPCAQLARALARGASERPITVFMPYSSQLSSVSKWCSQIWAESLGKNGKGLTPYPALGATDQHSQMQLYMEGPRDKCLVFVQVKKPGCTLPIPAAAELSDLSSFALVGGRTMAQLLEAEFRATRDAMTEAGVANCTLELDALDAYSLGAFFYFWEWATAIAGVVLDVNPFDQPGVEAAKVLTKKYLAKEQ